MAIRSQRANRAANRLSTVLLCAACLAAGSLLLLAPGESLKGARSGLTLCADVVIPSLFPFMCLSGFIIRSGLAQKAGRFFEPVMRFLFRMPGCTALALGLGIIGGYPVGASATADLCASGAIGKRQGERLLCYCINSSPAFIIGAVGAGILRSAKAGILLYAAHIGASIVLGIIMGLADRMKSTAGKSAGSGKISSVPEAFVGSVAQAAESMLAICAFVVLFASIVGLLVFTGALGSLAALLTHIFPFESESFFNSLLIGMLEVTNGCAGAAAKGSDALVLLPVVLSFSGLSVFCQVMATVRKTGLSIRLFVATRLLHIVLSLTFSILLFRLFPTVIPTFASSAAHLSASVHSAPSCAALLLFSAMLLLSLLRI